MRRSIASLFSIFVAGTAFAQAPLENCAEIPNLAADVMIRRQVNYDIMLMINNINSQLNDHPELLSWVQTMIDMAYAQAVDSSEEARAQQVRDFQTLWNERCMKQLP
ncbi:MAG: hypothetical protein Q8L60_17205 [Gammaproteobacteria bacterium]|nr:hypothetical protein [Gammaproteobacteria bacterium]MDP2140643.1 hypothetical protein [Gammaproteobacteria bacterium]MDP2347415.1 hypothetical protein [Gammaproteobacteria bacterium]